MYEGQAFSPPGLYDQEAIRLQKLKIWLFTTSAFEAIARISINFLTLFSNPFVMDLD